MPNEPRRHSVAAMMARSAIGVLLGALLLTGCIDLDVPTADELVGYLDRLDFGPEWRLQSEEIAEDPCEITESCPRAVRIYRVAATEFPSTISILQAAGLVTRTPFQSCMEAPERGCSTQGWDEDVVITMTIASEHGTDVEVQVKASETVGQPPSD